MSNYIGNPGTGSSSTATTPQSTASTTPPVSPNVGDIWHDTDDDTTYLRIEVGGGNQVWLDISSGSGQKPKMTTGSILPTSPSLGDKHYDTDDGRVYLYTNDGTANIWLEITG